MTLWATGYGKGSWTNAYGLLGTNMIDVPLSQKMAYESIFHFSGNKLLESLLIFGTITQKQVMLQTLNSIRYDRIKLSDKN